MDVGGDAVLLAVEFEPICNGCPDPTLPTVIPGASIENQTMDLTAGYFWARYGFSLAGVPARAA